MGQFRNRLLQHLEAESIERLKLRPVTLKYRQSLEDVGRPIMDIVFLEEGIASMAATFRDGCAVEVSVFGVESVVGVAALTGTKKSLNPVTMQVAGHGYFSPMQAAVAEFRRHERFHSFVLRNVQAQLVQMTQSAACNAHHRCEQRLARWLLICADSAYKASLVISQEFLAEMLGGSRSSVSLATIALKKQGVISYKGGLLTILNHQALERRSCECYSVVKQHLDEIDAADTESTGLSML